MRNAMGRFSKYFKRNEFPEPLEQGDIRLLRELVNVREALGRPINPSPVSGAFARRGGSVDSQHYIGRVGEESILRQSTAIDFFAQAYPIAVLWTLMNNRKIGGIGVYFNGKYGGKPHVRWHMDIRPGRLIWRVDVDEVDEKEVYTYITSPSQQAELLTDLIQRKTY